MSLFLLWYFAAWGWILLAVAGGALLVHATMHTRRRLARCLTGVVFIVVALIWQQATLSGNFGRNYRCLYSRDGETKVHIRHKWSNYSLVVERPGRNRGFHLAGMRGGAPEYMFWIEQDKTIGVEMYGGRRAVFDIDLLLMNEVELKKLPPEVREKSKYFRRLTSEEEKAFDAAKEKALAAGTAGL